MTDRLLDVNALLALAWPSHQFHGDAHRWFGPASRRGWCTCALTQSGFVRLSSNPAFTPDAKPPAEAVRLLSLLVGVGRHRFLAAAPPLTDPSFHAIASRMLGHRQVTDACLLHVAARARVRIATFDRRLPALAPDPAIVELIPIRS